MDGEGGRWVFPLLGILLPMITSLGFVGLGFAGGYAWAKGRRGVAGALLGLAVFVVLAMAGGTFFLVFGFGSMNPVDDVEQAPTTTHGE